MTTLRNNTSLTIVVISSLTTYSTAGYIVEALIAEGHSVFVISDANHPSINARVNGVFNLPTFLNQKNLNPDLVLFIEGGSMQLFPIGLDAISCLTAWYGIDTHMNYQKHLFIARLFDVTFVAQKEYVERFIADGIRQVSWLPLAAAPSIYPNGGHERKYDISYVGSNDASMHPERHQILATLQKQFSNVWIGKASPIEMGRIYSESKMVFNRSINNDVNMRIFEAMGAGAVLLTNEISHNGLEDLFPTNKPFIVYKNEADLLRSVNELLNDPERLNEMGAAAKALIEEQHTYQLRTQVLVSSLLVFSKMPPPSNLDLFSALLSMDMLAPAFNSLASLLRGQKSVGVAGTVKFVCAFVLNGLSGILSVLYWIKDSIKKHS